MEDLSMMKILIVDDIEDNIEVLLGILADDYDISVAMDGERALEIVEEDMPDLILLDIMMPGIDGYEVCQKLKSSKKTNDIPIIFLTAKSEIDDETHGLEIGAVDYLTKPISPPIVQVRVKTQLERKKHKDELKKAYGIIEAQKERMEKELNSGRDIQKSMVPRIFPPFPDRHEFSIYAKLRPAREVGGDFYDFFFIDENHLCVCVGDVSGKGVPASLYMAVTLTLIRSIARDHLSTASIVTRMNYELCAQNEEAMFVTLFAGILNLDKGDFTYTNAGHNPSYFVKVDDEPKPLEDIHGIPLGIFPGKQYDQDRIHLDKGDFLLMYTDGVTDSRNEKKEMFGDHRLVELILSNKKDTVETLVASVFAVTKLFGGDEDQYDDTTVMALKYRGK
jgi:serine phosphatase RsbU (regulator of sigma subunit)